MKSSRLIIGILALSLGSSLAMGPMTANAASTAPYQAHLRLRLKAKPSKSPYQAHAKTTAKKKAKTTTYGKLSKADKKRFKLALSNQKQPLTAATQLDKKTKQIKTYYAYSFKLTNKTKKNVKFYFSNLRYNIYDLTNKTVPAKNVKPAATVAHITLKPGASKTVKQAVSMTPTVFTNKTNHQRVAFLTYGKLANNKAMLAALTLAKNTK